MRKLILILILFKVQFNLAFGEGVPTQSCLNGIGCLSDSQCGENGKCQFPEISAKPSIGYVSDYSRNQSKPLIWQFVCLFV